MKTYISVSYDIKRSIWKRKQEMGLAVNDGIVQDQYAHKHERYMRLIEIKDNSHNRWISGDRVVALRRRHSLA